MFITCDTSSGDEVLDAAAKLKSSPLFEFVEPNFVFCGEGAGSFPDDPLFSYQWGLENTGQSGGVPGIDINVVSAWNATLGADSAAVGIIDTGVQLDHPDLYALPGCDSTSDGPGDGSPVYPCDSHGTPVAGVISARIDNSIGTAGVAPQSPAVPLRSFISMGCSGGWTTQVAWTVDSLAWAEANGIRITNNSNVYGFESAAIAAKYADTRAGGMIHFAAAGNTGLGEVEYPARLASVLAVSAIDSSGTLAAGSSWGDEIAFAGPGLGIFTTDVTGADGWSSGDVTEGDGTSLAVPFVAGVASLVLANRPFASVDQIEFALTATARDIGPSGADIYFGAGLPNATNALNIEFHPSFVRGDVNGDGAYDISDAVQLLGGLFLDSTIACEVSADVNDDEIVDIADAVFVLSSLFSDGPAPSPPFPGCSTDPTRGALTCLMQPCT